MAPLNRFHTSVERQFSRSSIADDVEMNNSEDENREDGDDNFMGFDLLLPGSRLATSALVSAFLNTSYTSCYASTITLAHELDG